MLTRQHGKLDFELIRTELKPRLELKGETEALGKVDQMIARVDRQVRAKL